MTPNLELGCIMRKIKSAKRKHKTLRHLYARAKECRNAIMFKRLQRALAERVST